MEPGFSYSPRDPKSKFLSFKFLSLQFGAQPDVGEMQIVNESDRDVTWWCYNSEDKVQEATLIGGKGDIRAKSGRASFNPPSNATGYYYVQFTAKVAT
jgi:hypothetical protein